MTKGEIDTDKSENKSTFHDSTPQRESPMFTFRSRRFTLGKNTGEGYRKGAVRGRTQFQHENGDWQKRDEGNGQFMERKSSPGPFKDVAKEPDGRDTENS